MHLARLALRTAIGGLFIGHGTQKLFGSFGGPGIAGTEGVMEALGMRPARQHAYAAGVTEAGGGALLALGLATPLASAGLIGVMVTAIRKVHWPKGPWVTNGGYEYNLVLIAALAALAESGPGAFSLDRARGRERHGARYGLGALALGALASTAAVEYGRRSAPAEAAPSTEPPAMVDLTDGVETEADTDAPT
ncbi:MAG: DoxX family protein [Mycobacteriales bacterium]